MQSTKGPLTHSRLRSTPQKARRKKARSPSNSTDPRLKQPRMSSSRHSQTQSTGSTAKQEESRCPLRGYGTALRSPKAPLCQTQPWKWRLRLSLTLMQTS